MSGQWEVVGKSKQKQSRQSARKLAKSERKKFVENAPKVEDILPLAQVKTLYTALDSNKENHKPPSKETNVKENDLKKTQKKQPEKKKEVKERQPTPKSLEMAVRLIDVKEITSQLEIGQARFQDAPLVWLRGLTDYLNVKLEHSNPVLTPKSTDYPLCVMSGEIRDVLRRAIKDAGETATQHFFHICLGAMADDMIRGSSLIYGYKVMLQLLAFQNPNVTVSNIQKVTSLRNSYQNRQPILLTILWALGQGGMKDTQIGLKVWLDVMVPVMEMRNYTVFVVNYLKDVLNHSPQGRPVNCEQFFSVLDIIHSPSNNLPNNVRQELLSLSPALRLRAMKDISEKRLRNFFELFLQRLQPSASKMLKEELLTCLLICLSNDQHCYSVWRQLYTKHLPQSAVLLDHIDRQWNAIKEQVTVKVLRETLSTFQVTNEELRKGKQKDEQHLIHCQHSCESQDDLICM